MSPDFVDDPIANAGVDCGCARRRTVTGDIVGDLLVRTSARLSVLGDRNLSH